MHNFLTESKIKGWYTPSEVSRVFFFFLAKVIGINPNNSNAQTTAYINMRIWFSTFKSEAAEKKINLYTVKKRILQRSLAKMNI
jgi:hypothetical protein